MREKILEGTFRRISTYGIKKVSMDDIAKSIKISKNTIYEHFDSKEELVLEAFKSKAAEQINRFNAIADMQQGTIRKMFARGIEVFKFFNGVSPIFWEEIKQDPEFISFVKELKSGQHAYGNNRVNEGIKEGVFVSNANFDILIETMNEQQSKYQNLENNDMDSKYSPLKKYLVVLTTMLRGISTDKGRAEIDKIEAENILIYE